MRLGRSMRRRRPSGGGTAPPSARRVSKRQAWRGSRNLELALLAMVVGLIGTGSGYLYATHVVFPPAADQVVDFLEVPNLRSLPLADAETFILDRGLEVGSVGGVHHPDVPEGWVLGQSPLPGQLAAGGREVELTVSLGPERRVVPDVTRLRSDRALTVLRSTGFLVAVDSIESEVPLGQVVATFPEAGAELPLPTEVRLAVSLGLPLLPMPRLAGLQEEQARVLLDSLGLVVGEVDTRFRFGFSQGEVLEHFPLADSLIPVGTEVRLTVGRRGILPDP